MRHELIGGPHDGKIVNMDCPTYRIARPLKTLENVFADPGAVFGPPPIIEDTYHAVRKFDPGSEEEPDRPPSVRFLAIHAGARLR